MVAGPRGPVERFTAPIIDDPALPLSDLVIAGAACPAIISATVLVLGLPRPSWLVALPGALTMWMEWWAFEGLSVLCGLLPNATVLLAAHGTHRAAELSFTRFEDLCGQAGQDA